jgi:hypothetical protein
VTKETKAASDYRTGSAARHCSICTMWQPPNGCTKVAGTISPQGLCDYFEKKPSVAENIRDLMARRS